MCHPLVQDLGMKACVQWTACSLCCMSQSQAALHYSGSDQSSNDFFAKYAEAALDTLPKNAVVLSKGDNLVNLMRFKQVCEGVRPFVMPYMQRSHWM